MRDGGGTLGTCLAKAQGEDSDERLCCLRTQESPCPPGAPCWAPSWANRPTADVHGNSQNETLSLEMRSDLSEAGLLLHGGTKVLAYLKESVRRNSTPTVAQSETVGLFFAPAEEGFAGPSLGVKEAWARDWVGGRPRATKGHRGRCRRGEPRGSGLPCRQKRSDMGISEDEPSALEGRGSELEPSRRHPVLRTPLHAQRGVFPRDGTARAPPGSEPLLPGQTAGCRKMLPRGNSASRDLQATPGPLAVQAPEVAKPLRHG